MTRDNYLYRKKQFVRSFEKLFVRLRPSIIAWLGEEQANQLIQNSLREYEALIPRIPFIGNGFYPLSFFLPTTRYVAVYRQVMRQGLTLEDAGRLVLMLGTEEARMYPNLVKRLIKSLWFSSLAKALLKRREKISHQRRYPGNFVLNYVDGDGQTFDFGVDYLECANIKFLLAENAFELAPYVCATDKPISEILGWGLTRTKTISEGYPTCEFRFTKGGKTRVVVPESIQGLIELETLESSK